MPSLMDYNPYLEELSSTRTVFVDTGWEEDRLKAFLEKHKSACIYNTLSHKPISDDQIVLFGESYIDAFGLHVYIKSNVSWTAKDDVDERFNYDEYPENDLEPELYDYFSG